MSKEKIVYITRRERFSAAHKLYREEWSLEKNYEVFGKCSNVNWHGHNYEMFVTLKGSVDEKTGFVADLSDVSKILKVEVIDKLDHKNLNLDVDFMKSVTTSTENLAIKCWEAIEERINNLGCKLHCIKITETENNSVEYYG